MKKLLQQLKQLDGKGYKAYKDIQGKYEYDGFSLHIDYVQGDPFASPSKIRVVVPQAKRPIKQEWLEYNYRQVATSDAIARSVGKAIAGSHFQIKGSGKSGAVMFDSPGQEVLERSAVQAEKDGTTICISVGLPANGRRINGKEAMKLFETMIPEIVNKSIFTITDETIEQAVQLADQQEAIQDEMKKQGWISFIANGSILPRESGVSNRPLKQAIRFQSPQENEVTITLPHRTEPVSGMAIHKGITLIAGGGYHGKSTVLEAVERGVYPHVKGDGREFVLTNPDAMKIRAEDGRQITGVNISPFISNLPHKQDTNRFSTENASGSTSQAANVMEALEVGATTLLIDEDTSATNFMIRDHRMQQLVSQEQEPITPFIDKVKQMRDQLDVSTILVMGGSGDYFAVADDVVMMDEYVPYNVTEKAKAIMEDYPIERDSEKSEAFGTVTNRRLKQNSLQTQKGKRAKTQAKGLTTILMGRTEVSFDETEQLIDASQTRMIAEIIAYLDRTNGLEKANSLTELLTQIDQKMDQDGLAAFTTFPNQHPGDIARPRRYEIAAVLNRVRTLKVDQL